MYARASDDEAFESQRGWTGDGGHAAETLIMNFDMAAPYRKWLGDIDDAAVTQETNGDIPEIAPDLFGGKGAGNSDPAWAAGFIDVLDWVHRHYGDDGLLATHYTTASRYLAYLTPFVTNATGHVCRPPPSCSQSSNASMVCCIGARVRAKR
jgi:alpha-L-rhamnosidase